MHLNFKEFLEGYDFWGSAGAGILPIARDTGRVLLNHRSAYVNEPNTWGVWGGKIDDDEMQMGMDFATVARREFCEESGYCGDIRLIPGSIYRTNNFEYHNFFGILPSEFTPRIPEEHRWETQGWKWVSLEELERVNPKHFGLERLLAREKTLRIFNRIKKAHNK